MLSAYEYVTVCVCLSVSTLQFIVVVVFSLHASYTIPYITSHLVVRPLFSHCYAYVSVSVMCVCVVYQATHTAEPNHWLGC